MTSLRRLLRQHPWLPLLLVALGLVLAGAAMREPAEQRLAPVSSMSTEPAGTTARQGSLWLPRGGPTIIGFLSPGPARLVVGEHELTGSGLVRRRVVWPAPGALALRFAAPPGARLLWNPPGRRGAMEYVPASSLSPLPPGQAHFGAGAGALRAEAALASLAALLVLAALLLALRVRLALVAPRTWAVMAAVLALALAARCWGLGEAGQTWDEDMYWTSGRNLVHNALALELDPSWWRWNAEHPPVTKYFMGLGALWADALGPARLVSALLGALACALLVPIATRLGARGAGALAGIAAALSPHLVAHGQIIGHESPALLWWVLGMLLALEVHRADEQGPLPRRALLARLGALGVVVGLSVSTRFVGGLLGPAALAVVWAHAPVAQRRRTVALAALIVPAVSLVTFVALWPWLWHDPVARLAESWRVLRAAVSPEPYLGAMTAYPPRSYFAVYLVATAPVGVLLGAALWALQAVRARWPWRRAHASSSGADPAARLRVVLTLAAWLLLPLVVSLSPVRKDGVRYVIPAVAGLALAAGLGLAGLAARWPRRGPAGAGALLTVYLGLVWVRARPYHLDFYSELFGGAAQVAARHRFETAWWGEGIDRAVAYVNQHAAAGARVARTCVAPTHLTWFRQDLWQPMVATLEEAEWIVTYAPVSYPCPVPAAARRVFVVEHRGLVLAEVYRRP